MPRTHRRAHRGLLLTLALAASMLSSACTETDGEECPPANPVAVVGLAGTASLRLAAPDGSEVIERYEVEESGAAIPIDRYLLSIQASVVPAEARRAASGGPLDWFVGTARASCIGGVVRASQRLGALDVVSDAALSDALPAGASLAGVARLHRSSFTTVSPTDGRIERALRFPSDDPRPVLNELDPDAGAAPLDFGIRLDADVGQTAVHRFTVTYALEDGDVFTAVAGPVTLTPVGTGIQ